MTDRLDGISEFVHVVEAGSFAAAAGSLHLTRSAVGKIVARLEQRLGVRLFQRTTRRQALTEEGQLFYAHSVRILAELRAAEAAVDAGRETPSGRLRVSVPVLFGRLRVSPILTALVREFDALSLEMLLSDQIDDLVQDGIDLAVRIGPLKDSASLTAKRLTAQKMVVCGAPEYFARHGRPRRVADIADHDGVICGRSGYESGWLLTDEQGHVTRISPPSRIVMNDLQGVADHALAGLGLAWLPSWLIEEDVAAGRLEPALEAYHSIETVISAVWPTAAFLPTRTRAAIDRLAEGLKGG